MHSTYQVVSLCNHIKSSTLQTFVRQEVWFYAVTYSSNRFLQPDISTPTVTRKLQSERILSNLLQRTVQLLSGSSGVQIAMKKQWQNSNNKTINCHTSKWLIVLVILWMRFLPPLQQSDAWKPTTTNTQASRLVCNIQSDPMNHRATTSGAIVRCNHKQIC